MSTPSCPLDLANEISAALARGLAAVPTATIRNWHVAAIGLTAQFSAIMAAAAQSYVARGGDPQKVAPLEPAIAQLNARMLPVLQGLGTPAWDAAMHGEASVTALREEVAALQGLAKLMGLFERMSSKLH